MIRKILPFIFLVSSNTILSSDFGTTGLLDIPSARMSNDGELTGTTAIRSRNKSIALTYQIMPWMEGTFRYTGHKDFELWDRNFEVKVRLFQETNSLPEIAIGIRDIAGTGFWASEYLVAY